jgi:hypothetical protein
MAAKDKNLLLSRRRKYELESKYERLFQTFASNVGYPLPGKIKKAVGENQQPSKNLQYLLLCNRPD